MAGSHENPVPADAPDADFGVKTAGDTKDAEFTRDPDTKGSEFNDVSSPASVTAVPVALPKGSTDSVYEAKARVLNEAVRSAIDFLWIGTALLTQIRFKKLEWAGINGNCLLSWALDGQTTTSGLL